MVNKQARDPGEVRQFNEFGRVGGDIPSFAVDRGAAARALAEVGAGLSGPLLRLAEEAKAKAGAEAGLGAGATNGAAYLEMKAAEQRAEGARVPSTGPWKEQAKALLRKEEGYRETPYWDVTANRVGYGSDTTIIDGKPVKVTKGMKITRDQAEADLDYRLSNREGAQVQKQLGAAWEALPDSAKAALASVGYNYGSLPSSVVKAARTGDLGAIAAAVEALPANRDRRKREAAMIRGGGAAAPSGNPDAGLREIDTAPLALRRDGTAYGEAYDKAAISAYTWRVEQGLANDIMAAAEEFEDDPVRLQARLGEIRATYLQDDNLADPQLRESFEAAFAARSSAYMMKATAAQGQKLKAEQTASTAEGLQARAMDLERQAYTLGANPDGDTIIADQTARTFRAIDGALEQGAITPAQAAQWRQDVSVGVARGRVQGAFAALATPQEKEKFAIGLLDEWKTGEGPLAALDLDQVKALSSTLFAEAGKLTEAQRSQQVIETARVKQLVIDDVASIGASGQGITPDEGGLDAATVEAALGPEGLLAWQQSREAAADQWRATNGMESQSEAQILARIDAIKPKPGEPGYEQSAATWAAARKRAGEIIDERAKDPLGQAMRSGAIDVQPLDFSSGETIAASLAARRDAARGVSALYGTPRRYFMPGEQERIVAEMDANPMALQAFAQSAVKTLGPEAPAFLAEISDAAPVLAHSAGIATITGETSIAADVALALQARRDKLFTAKMPEDGKLRLSAEPMLGGALAALPKTQSALLGTATLLFEQAANRQGFDTKDVDKPRTAANEAWQAAIERAAGRRRLGGVDYGGFGQVNGGSILVPPDMPTERPQEIWSALDDEILPLLPPAASGNGIALTARQLRRGQLVTAGDGVYRVALGDPQSDNPQWVATPDGRFWEVDIRALARIREGR